MYCKWEGIAFDYCHGTRLPHTSCLFCFDYPSFLANYLSTNLHADGCGDRWVLQRSNAWFPRCSCKGQARGEVRQVFCLVNVRLKYKHWKHSGQSIVFESTGERRQQNRWSVIYIPPSIQRETGEVFLSVPQWISRAAGKEEGRGIRVDIWKERGREWQ